ncbi:MAG: HEAT repeat domain-containing protein, partial [Candidatus Brocadiae bacterium]|nr:HEAT repeat domain-containing protein [Candidatus Brocadiia bacterium]
GLLSGRGGAGRGDLLRRNGGGADTERAVVDGLDWLARHQSPDGSWGSRTPSCPQRPACSVPDCDNTVASTAFALLAFAGHGVTHMDGGESAWAPVVDRGLRFLLKSQRESGLLVTAAWSTGSDMYVHAAATLAIAELSAMTQDPRLRRPLLKAVDYIVSRQQSCGGWDYQEGVTGRGDASIGALVVQAIRAARAAGVVVPRKCWEEACRFYETVLIPGTGQIAYHVNPGRTWAGVSGAGRSLDAAGHFARRCLGLREPAHVQDRVDAHLQRGFPALTYGNRENGHPVYFTYYATLYFFSEGGSPWTRWNARLKEELLPAQARAGCARGSWDAAGTDMQSYGRAILTAFCVLNLEIYYRYLPSSGQDPAAYARLGDGDGDDTEFLIARLESPAMDIRRAAAKRLEKRDEAGVFEALADAAAREKTSLRELLVRSLGNFAESPDRRDRLMRFCGEGEREAVRREAEQVLDRWLRKE